MGRRKPKHRKTKLQLLENLDRKQLGILIVCLACLLYANTLGHDYALDDAILITDNEFTKRGLQGIHSIFTHDTFYGFFRDEGKANLVAGGRYRPLSQATFAFEVSLFGLNPFYSHLFNLLWYAGCCLLVFLSLGYVLKEYNTYSQSISVVTAILFTLHPIHTEVVANIKGRDEIMALTMSLGALWYIFKYQENKSPGFALCSAMLFLGALMSKEVAVSFLGVVPLALYFFRKTSISQILVTIMPLFAALVLYLGIRFSVLGWNITSEPPMELMNNPFLMLDDGQYRTMSWLERAPMIVYGWAKYIQLSLFPHPLTHDYYPRHIPVYTWANGIIWLSLVLLLALQLVIIRTWNQQRLISFSLLYFIGTLLLTSNVFFPIGTNLSERFLFMPSVGICLAISYLLLEIRKKYSGKLFWIITVFICIAAITKTIDRNQDWKNNHALFTTDVHTSSGSAKAQNAAGGTLIEKALSVDDTLTRNSLLRQALTHLAEAIDIHPTYKNAYLLRGNAYYYLRNYPEAIAAFDIALSIDPGYPEARTNRAYAQRDMGRYAGELENDLHKAVALLEQAHQILETDYETNRLLGIAHGNLGNHAQAIHFFNEALQVQPNDGWAHYNLSVAYRTIGDTLNANRYLSRALELNPKINNR